LAPDCWRHICKRTHFRVRRPECLFVIVLSVIVAASTTVLANDKKEKSTHEDLIAEERPEETVGRYMYWEDGIRLTGRHLKYTLKIGSKIYYDLGNIEAGEELQEGFPDLQGFHGGFRKFNVALLGRLSDLLEFKIEFDLANAKDIKDNWLRITKGSVLPLFTFGHMKEPFSMDEFVSSNYRSAMEQALPTKAFAPGRSIGVTSNGTFVKGRLTWAAGAYFNTGSFDTVGEAKDAISNHNGWNLTGRVTGLPAYKKESRNLVHLGLSFSHSERDESAKDHSAQFWTRPESRLTDDRIVNTKTAFNKRKELLGLEVAWKRGPFMLAGEYMHVWVDAVESLDFNGWYVTGSWILTGESRTYNRSGGVFAEVRPEENFNPGRGGGVPWRQFFAIQS
jgi:phosphate-selective porin OprO/OprP